MVGKPESLLFKLFGSKTFWNITFVTFPHSPQKFPRKTTVSTKCGLKKKRSIDKECCLLLWFDLFSPPWFSNLPLLQLLVHYLRYFSHHPLHSITSNVQRESRELFHTIVITNRVLNLWMFLYNYTFFYFQKEQETPLSYVHLGGNKGHDNLRHSSEILSPVSAVYHLVIV